MRRTRMIERMLLGPGVTDRGAISPDDARWFGDRFRDPVCARAATDTYRTFLLRELPGYARRPERRRTAVPIRVLHGVDDFAIHRSLASERTALADDYRVEYVDDCGHFIVDERPDLVRKGLLAVAAETAGSRRGLTVPASST